MADMFTAENSPFYESASLYTIDRIDRPVYARFISERFAEEKKRITEDAVAFILDWTCTHTFYTQFLCNRVFQIVKKEATLMDVLNAADAILQENHVAFLEREVSEPTGAAFVQKYNLGASSTVVRLLNSLTDKEILLETKTAGGSSYRIYNVFFSRWLERQ